MHTYIRTKLKTVKLLFSGMSNLQSHYHFKLDSKMWKTYRRQTVNPKPHTPQGFSCKAWNSPVEYPSKDLNITWSPKVIQPHIQIDWQLFWIFTLVKIDMYVCRYQNTMADIMPTLLSNTFSYSGLCNLIRTSLKCCRCSNCRYVSISFGKTFPSVRGTGYYQYHRYSKSLLKWCLMLHMNNVVEWDLKFFWGCVKRSTAPSYISMLWKDIDSSVFFTRGQFWLSDIAVACICPCVCVLLPVRPCVKPELIRAITCDPFKPGSPHLNQSCKTPWLRSLVFCAVIDLDSQCQIYIKIKMYPSLSLSAPKPIARWI